MSSGWATAVSRTSSAVAGRAEARAGRGRSARTSREPVAGSGQVEPGQQHAGRLGALAGREEDEHPSRVAAGGPSRRPTRTEYPSVRCGIPTTRGSAAGRHARASDRTGLGVARRGQVVGRSCRPSCAAGSGRCWGAGTAPGRPPRSSPRRRGRPPPCAAGRRRPRPAACAPPPAAGAARSSSPSTARSASSAPAATGRGASGQAATAASPASASCTHGRRRSRSGAVGPTTTGPSGSAATSSATASSSGAAAAGTARAGRRRPRRSAPTSRGAARRCAACRGRVARRVGRGRGERACTTRRAAQPSEAARDSVSSPTWPRTSASTTPASTRASHAPARLGRRGVDLGGGEGDLAGVAQHLLGQRAPLAGRGERGHLLLDDADHDPDQLHGLLERDGAGQLARRDARRPPAPGSAGVAGSRSQRGERPEPRLHDQPDVGPLLRRQRLEPRQRRPSAARPASISRVVAASTRCQVGGAASRPRRADASAGHWPHRGHAGSGRHWRVPGPLRVTAALDRARGRAVLAVLPLVRARAGRASTPPTAAPSCRTTWRARRRCPSTCGSGRSTGSPGRLVDGVLTVAASEQRSQLQNREAAERRLAQLLREAVAPPPQARRATRPTRGSQERRLAGKKQRSDVKRGRRDAAERAQLATCRRRAAGRPAAALGRVRASGRPRRGGRGRPRGTRAAGA